MRPWLRDFEQEDAEEAEAWALGFAHKRTKKTKSDQEVRSGILLLALCFLCCLLFKT